MTEVLSGDDTATVAGADADTDAAGAQEYRSAGARRVRLVPRRTPEPGMEVPPALYRDFVEVLQDAVRWSGG